MAAALLASAGLAVAPAEAASTGTWTPTANGGTAVAGGVTVTVNGVGTGGTAPTASTLNTGNTASFWTNPYSGGTPTQATPALSFVLAPQGTTLTATFTFSKAVDNPVIHFARLGGAVGTVSNTSVWALSGSTSTGGSVTTSLLAGSNTQFQYTSSNFQRTPNAVTAATNPGICVAGDATHMACGSIQFNGTGITQLTFTITWAGATGGIGDGIDVALSIPDTKVVINKQSAGGTNTFSFTGTNGVANASLNTATSNPIAAAASTVTDNSQPIVITEGAGPSPFTLASASCVDQTATAVTSSLSGNALTIAAANYKGGGQTITCTFVNAAADMSISLAGLPTTGSVGTPYSGTFTCTNAAAPALAATTPTCAVSGLPAGLTTSCSPTNPASLAPSAVITCTVSGTPIAAATTNLTGTTGATNDGNAANNTAATSITFTGSDMTPDMSGLPTTASVGVAYSGTLKCTNNAAATAAATNATCSASGLPPGVTVGTCSPLPPATVAAGASISCPVSGTPTAPGSTTLTATTGATNDTNGGTTTGGNNQSTLAITTTGSDMTPDVSGLPATATFGVAYSGTLKCTNSATATASATNATCSISGLPPGVTVGTCSPLPPATVAAGASISCPVSGTPTATGSTTLTATTGATNDTNGGTTTGGNNQTTKAVVTSGSDMSIDLSTLPTTANVGVPYSGMFTCKNVSATIAATAATCATNVPTGFTETCSPTPPVSVATGASITCTLWGTPTTTGPITLNGTTGATNDGNAANNTATTTIGTTGSDMAPDVTGLPTTATVGTPYSGTITCTNSATATASALSATCSVTGLPPGVTVGTCSPVPPASVAVGASISCPVSGTPTTSGSVTATVTTGATNDTNGGTGTGGNNQTTVAIATTGSDMSISLAGLPTTGSVGTPYSGTFTCTNAVAPALAATSPTCAVAGLPAGLTTVCSPNNPATLAPSGVITCTVSGTPIAAATANLTGTTGATNDGNSANNTATTTITFTGSDMTPDVSGLPTTASVGVAYSGTLKCTNNAAATASAASATCSVSGLPPGVTIGTCSPVPPATVAAGASISCPVSGTPTATGSTTLTATTGATNDTNGGATTGGNNQTTLAITTTGSDMTPDVSGLPATATLGVAYSGTLKCTNNATATASATNATCSVTGLPPGVTVGACSPVPPATVAAGASISCPVSGTPTASGATTLTATTGATNDANGGTTTGGNNQTTKAVTTSGSDMSIDLSTLPTTATINVPYSGTFACKNLSATITATAATCATNVPTGFTETCSPTPPTSVAPGASITCTLSGTPTTTGPIAINGTTGATNDGNPANNTATTTIGVTGSDMAPDVTGLPTTATVGTPYSGTVKCTNSASATAAAISASCSVTGLPAGVTVGPCSPTPPASVAIGASISCPVSGTPTTSGSVTATVTTGATNDTNGGTTTGGNNQTTVSIATAGSDMVPDVSGLPTTASIGVPYNGTLKCTNSASTAPTAAATNATCALSGLPAGLSVGACSPSPPIAVGVTISCPVTGTPTTVGSSSLTATTGATNDTNGGTGTGGNNSAFATLTVTGTDMAPDLSGLPATATVGTPYSGTVLCTNLTTTAAVASTCTVNGLPPGVTVGTCTPTPPASVAGNASISCPVSGTPTTNGTTTASVTTGATNDTNGGTGTGGNNTATKAIATSGSDMSIDLSGLPTTGATGQPYSGTYTCTNASSPAVAATSASCLVTSLPVGLIASCSPTPPATVSPGASISCTVSGTPTTAGSSTVNGSTGATNDGNPANNTATTAIAIGTPALSIAKSTTMSSFSAPGVVVPYTFTVTNTGTVTIVSAITVSDSKIASVSCPALPSGGLAPNASITCSGSYTTSQADVDAGNVTNVASAKSGTTTSPTGSHVLPAAQSPSLSVAKATTATNFNAVGTSVPYTFTVKNTGNTTLTNAVTVTDSKIASVSCPSIGAGLAPGGTIVCSGTYTTTQADKDAGSVTNTATAKSGPTSGTDTHTLPAVQSPALTIAKSTPTSSFSATGVSISYSYVVTNTGNTTITTAVSVSDNKISSVTCPSVGAGLAPNGTLTCTGTYTTTQADLDAGGVTNTASASSGGTTSPAKSVTVPAVASRSLAMTKTASISTFSAPGTAISYTYVVKNTGNVTIPASATISVSDNKIASVTCPAIPAGGLAPNATLTCTASTVTTQADVDAGSITNKATATDGTSTSPQATATVTATQSPSISLAKATTSNGVSTVGAVVPYTFTVTNTGNTTITTAVSVSDTKIAAVSCPPIGAGLAPGGSTQCTGSYTTTQADLDGGKIVNTATATSGALSATDTHTLPATQGRSLSMTKTPSVSTFNKTGVTINYSYVVKNTGNTTIPASATISVTDNKVTVTCPAIPAGGIAPNATITCSAFHVTTQADLDAGSITNVASATDGTSVSPNATATVTGLQSQAMTISKATTASNFNKAGQSVPYTFTVTNTGNVTLTSAITVSDNKISSVSCPSIGTGLAPGSNVVCTGSYTTTQADVDSGSVINTASATSGTVTSPTDTHTLPAMQSPSLSIAKSSTTASFNAPGVSLPYSYVVTNTGNTTLTSAISVSDNKISSVSCPALPSGGLAPNGTITCSGSYVTTQADVDAGGVTNTASASSGGTTSTAKSLTIPATKTPALKVAKAASTSMITTAGQSVTYTYTVTNTGNTTLASAVTVSDNKIASVSCPALPSGGLAPAGTLTCTGTYIVTQADLDSGGVTNTATAASGPTVSPSTSLTVTATQSPSLSVVKTSTTSSFSVAGTTISYSYKVTNSGNTTLLSAVTITDDKIASASITCSPSGAGLAPGGSITCSGSYVTTQADVDAGGVTNTASAKSGTATSPAVKLTVTSTQTPALSIAKSTTATTYSAPGDVIPYNFIVTNAGNTTITTAVSVTDSKIGTISCPVVSGGLAPGANETCSASYTVTQADIDGGNILNTAFAKSGPTTSPTVTYNLKGTQNPKLTITKASTTSAITTLGQIVPYTFTATNTGNVTLTQAVVLTDNKISTVTCDPLPSGGLTPSPSPNSSINCTGSYTVTQADLDAGSVTNAAVATSGFGGTTTTSNQVAKTIPVTQSPNLTLVKSAPSAPYSAVGNQVMYTFHVTNTGNTTLTTAITIADDKISSVSCPSLPSGLAPGSATDCTGTYTVTQADIDNGSVVNTATAKSGPTVSTPPQMHTQNAAKSPALSLTKTASTGTYSSVGSTITYTYVVNNTGNTTFPSSSAVTVSDNKIASVSCPSVPPSGLAPNATLTCTATATVTQADIDNGSIMNTASASVTTGGVTTTSNTASATVTATAMPALSIVKATTATNYAAAGVSVPYTFTVTNSGNTTIKTAITVSDSKISSVSCPALMAAGLAPSSSITCTGSYTTTQADVDAGSVMNTASAASGATTSPSTSHTLPAAQNRALSLAKSGSPATYGAKGITITYSYIVTNSGNITIPASATMTISDNKLGTLSCPAIPAGGIAPGGTLTCTKSTVTTQADVDAGSITNIATATDGVVTSPSTSATVSANQAPSMSVVKNSTVSSYTKAGDVIPYTFDVTNNGNTTLTSAFTVADNRLASVTCPALPPGGLPPGGAIQCTGSYTITQADVDSGSVVNTASAKSSTTTSTPPVMHTLTGSKMPSLMVVKSTTATGFTAAGVTIPYSYKVTNNGNTTITSPIAITDNKIASVSCPALPSGGLLPNGFITCSGNYVTTQADVDGSGLTNTAFATSGPVTSPSVSITVTPTHTPALTIAKSTTATAYASVGMVLPYSYKVTNSGNTTVTTAITVSDNKIATVNCPALPSGGLTPAAAITCSGFYTVTQADIDAGKVTNVASATSGGVTSNTDTATVNATKSPALSIAKSSTTPSYGATGVSIPYKYVVTNTGNTTFAGPVSVTDDKIASVTCPALPSGLAPNASTTCTGSYTTTQADLDAGQIKNTAFATSNGTTSPTTSLTIKAATTAALSVVKNSASPAFTAPGATLSYTYNVTNAGNTTLTNAITVTDDKIASVVCGALPSGGLPPGGVIACTGSYTTTQADVDAGKVTNTASAASGAVTSPTTNFTVNSTKTPALTIAVTPSVSTYTAPNTVITYSYKVTNTGNTTLTSAITVADNKVTGVSCPALPPGGLAPGAFISCTATYVTTQADVDANKIVDAATATSGPTTSSPGSATVNAVQTPALTVAKSTTSSGFSATGVAIPYSYLVTNSGNTTLTSAVTVTDDKIASVSCPSIGTGLAPVASITCTGTYTTVQADLDAGKVTNNAFATSGAVKSANASVTVNAMQTSTLSIAKTSTVANFTAANTAIPYSYKVTNTSNTTLTHAITVSDNKIATVTCPSIGTGLAPGAFIMCSATYTTTQADVDAGGVTNTASAKSGTATSPTTSLTINSTTTPGLTVVKSTPTTVFTAPGTVIAYSYKVTNSGNTTLTQPIVATDDKITAVSCPALPMGGLVPGAFLTCTGSYTTTQADVDAGGVTNNASARSGAIKSPTVSVTVPATQTPAMTVVKSSTTATFNAAGTVIPYSYKVTNSGNTTLTTAITVSDDKIASVICPALPMGGLVPAAFITCTGSYTTTQADVDAGSVTNTASSKSGTVTSPPVSLKINATQAPGLSVVKTSTVTAYSAVGAVIPYSYKVTNTGNTTLTTAITVSDNKIATVTCPALPAGGLVPAAFITCTGNYSVVQADIDAGSLTNTASAKSGPVTSPAVTLTITATQTPGLTVAKTTTAASYSAVGDIIPYAYKVTNTGNTTLTAAVTVKDDKIASVMCPALPAGGLVPAAVLTCTGTYSITQADLDTGSVTNTATATSGTVVSPVVSLKLVGTQKPDFTVLMTAVTPAAINNGDGSFTAVYNIVTTNTGNVDLTDVQLVDNYLAILPKGASVLSAKVRRVASSIRGTLTTGSPTYTATSGSPNLLTGTGETLAIGENVMLEIEITFNPGGNPYSTAFENVVVGTTVFNKNTAGATSASRTSQAIVPFVANTPLMVSKTTPKSDITKGELVPYTITVANTASATRTGLTVIDNMPAGFAYRVGSANVNGVAKEPVISGRMLSFPNVSVAATKPLVVKVMLIAGAGIGSGEFTNEAWMVDGLGAVASNVGRATVRSVGDPNFDCTDIIGRVFDDANRNGVADDGERGIANVRLVTVRGQIITTDNEGRYHIACADIPETERGTNFILKLDERSLPSGYRMTSENPRVVRITAGKMAKINFGASISHVARLDLGEAAFEAGTTQMKPVWTSRLGIVMDALTREQSVLRIAYRRGADERPGLGEERMRALQAWFLDTWRQQGAGYQLQIETEVSSGQPGRR